MEDADAVPSVGEHDAAPHAQEGVGIGGLDEGVGKGDKEVEGDGGEVEEGAPRVIEGEGDADNEPEDKEGG